MMSVELVPCGEFSHGYGGDFERECARRLRDELPEGLIVATNVTLDRGGGSFLECDAVVSAPGEWVVLEMKALRPRVEVFEDVLRAASGFSIDRVFSTLDLKAKVLGSRRKRQPFPGNSAHLAGRVTTLVVVPDDTSIVFRHSGHGSSKPVRTVSDTVTHLKSLGPGLANPQTKVLVTELAKGWRAYAQSSAPAQTKNGRQIGRYKVRRQLGASASVTEYLAVDEPPCAADVRLREFRIDPALSERDLEDELSALARGMSVLRRIRHPHVSCVLSHFQTASSWVEVSDWFDGAPLETMWPAFSDLSTAERAGVGLKVLGALDYCHERGVFHRNVSAETVLVSAELDVRLCGFDLARDLGATSTLTSTTLARRDPRLVPPEELRGAVSNQRRGDIFQAGVLLYRLLEHGAWPFESTLSYATDPSHSIRPFSTPEDPESLAIRALTIRMLAVDPQRRPDVLKRVEQELEATLAGDTRR